MKHKRLTVLLLFFSVQLFANDDIDSSFITKFEYGAMLYKNPRGIGCHKCHAKGDKEVIIAMYKDKKGKMMPLMAPPIAKVSYAAFSKKLNAKKNRSLVMPTYFLTQNEIKSIYHYITTLNK